MAIYFLLSSLLLICVLSYGSQKLTAKRLKITIEEATVDDLQLAFRLKTLTSREVVLFYLDKIRELNENLRGVIEVNPDALSQADIADKERRECNHTLPKLHGIPILLKDNIATKDKLNTTAGSFALLGSIVPRDAGVVSKLRRSGAIISGKASLSEWSNFRTSWAPNGWSARGSQGKEGFVKLNTTWFNFLNLWKQNPYNSSVEVCGSSSGPAISVAANMVSVTLGTETDGSIICPASFNSVVGIKPTVGLTSRAGVIPISPRQDTVGPICRTVADSVHVLDIIVGIDRNDNATSEASKYIPVGGYGQFLKHNGLEGKRLGIVNMLFDSINHDVFLKQTFEQHFTTLRKQGAVLVDNLEIAHIEDVLDSHSSGEFDAMLAEFKIALNEYLGDLVKSPVKSLREVIEFNKNHSKEKINEYGQDIFELAEKTNGMGPKEQEALSNLKRLSKQGFKKLMTDHSLDALVAYANSASSILAIGGFPGIVVPAGYHNTKKYPFGICFGGLRGSEPKLIEIAYAFEQATKIRRKPPLA
ncbi:probable amidase At4g34880 isoform X2 [Rosa chinensis]|uniref:probable amidase At4g34880 isoform X2 n=1 Tax=Rosa chinensis TaxID=74649 RepID=UPI000D093B40|nr:probable amidase At4g34880 isoform X2 [Rosa chinensis]